MQTEGTTPNPHDGGVFLFLFFTWTQLCLAAIPQKKVVIFLYLVLLIVNAPVDGTRSEIHVTPWWGNRGPNI